MINPNETIYVSLATRQYGGGRICIHTDRINSVQTGHGLNNIQFWRKVFEWTGGRKPEELIKVGLIANTEIQPIDVIKTLRPISVKNIDLSYIATKDLSDFDCLYFSGLPKSAANAVTEKLEYYVREGGGIIIECPDNGGENINILRDIELIYCYSGDRIVEDFGYWTIDGNDHDLYYPNAKMAFVTSMRQGDFSSRWEILISNVENISTTTTTTTNIGEAYDLSKSASFEFAVSFISSMQNGIVTMYEQYSSSSSSDSSSSSSSSSSNSSESYGNVSSSSSSSSGIEFYRVSGNPVPDCKGDYYENGTFLSTPSYRRLDGAYWLYSYLGNHYISAIKGKLTPSFPSLWRRLNPVIEGVYVPLGLHVTGNPVVTKMG